MHAYQHLLFIITALISFSRHGNAHLNPPGASTPSPYPNLKDPTTSVKSTLQSRITGLQSDNADLAGVQKDIRKDIQDLRPITTQNHETIASLQHLRIKAHQSLQSNTQIQSDYRNALVQLLKHARHYGGAPSTGTTGAMNVHVYGLKGRKAQQVSTALHKAQELAQWMLNDLLSNSNNNKNSNNKNQKPKSKIFQKYFTTADMSMVQHVLQKVISTPDTLVLRARETKDRHRRGTLATNVDKLYLTVQNAFFTKPEHEQLLAMLHELTHFYGTEDLKLYVDGVPFQTCYGQQACVMLKHVAEKGGRMDVGGHSLAAGGSASMVRVMIVTI
jgi:hypothetical protein